MCRKNITFHRSKQEGSCSNRPGCQGSRVYSKDGLSCTITSTAGGMGGKTGLYDVGVPIKENTKKGYKMAYEGDSIDLGYAGMNTDGEEWGIRLPIR